MDDATIRNTTPATDATVRAGTQGEAERTIRPSSQPQLQQAGGNDFLLKGKIYHNLKCLSDNSGEAQVFLVSNGDGEFVLKVYYPNFNVKKSLLRIIQHFGFEMLVKVYDFGKTYVDGKNRDYELMEYLRGGTLNDYRLHEDFDQFRRIALQAAAALSYCHNNNVIHKDIKPSNYFFRDEQHTEVVLGDFGISSVMENDEKVHRTTQARTPVYAAPEMYNDVIDGVVEITPAVDYYSLGITLMTLWLGENPLSSNERVMMRKKNEGRLPRINELPERVKMIVQGLTAVNPQSRWTYDEVERWFLGEKVEVDISSPVLKYKSFIVDPDRNLVADNVHELIPLLLDNERLATNYLYNGRISNWLESCGNTKLSTVVRDITVNRYPVDQMAGLMAAIYIMEPTYPYKDLHGNLCDDIHSAAISVLSYSDEYAMALTHPNDRLFLYLESHSKCNVERIRSYFKPDGGIDGRIAVLRAVYEMDPDIPFLSKFPSATLAEIVRAFGTGLCTDDDWISLCDGRLLSWMYSHEDRMACEALRIMTSGKQPSRQLAYKVLYNVDRNAAYDLRDADTPQKVGEMLRDDLVSWQHLSAGEMAEKLADFTDPDGRFCYFAQLHGWSEQIGEVHRCFDMKSEENRERLSAYDLRTAAYRFCRILGVSPVYQLADGRTLTDGAHIDRGHYIEARSELRSGALSQWMAVFFHEDPAQNFEEPYSYERMLEKWVLAMGEIDPQQKHYKRFVTAKEQTARKYEDVRNGYKRAKDKEYIWRMTFYALCAVLMLFVLLFGISADGRNYMMAHPVISIGLPVGGMSAIIIGTRAFFRGYGFMFSCMWGMLGALSSAIPILTLKYVHHSAPSLFIPVVIIFTVIYMLICHFTDFRGDSKSDNQLINEVMEDDIKSTLLEPLYYTFKTKAYRFKGSKFGMLDDVQNQIRSISGESVLHYVLWCIMVGLLLVEFVMYSPSLFNVNNPDLKGWRMNPHNVVKQIQKDVE